MEMEMQHLDAHKPSVEETAKINEFVSYLVSHGYEGLVLIHKADIGVSWLREENADSIRHLLINSVGHIYDAQPNTAVDMAKGIIMAADQLKV